MERIRLCDGACCKASPLRAVQTPEGQDCFFRDPLRTGSVRRGCTAIQDPRRVTTEMTPKERKRFDLACLNWPQNTTRTTQNSFGECCWRFDVTD